MLRTLAVPDEAPLPRFGIASTVVKGNRYLFSGHSGTDITPIEEQGPQLPEVAMCMRRVMQNQLVL
jgi:hypothetical protein